MDVLVLGCGEMGQVAVADLLKYGQIFRRVGIGTRHPERVEAFLGSLPDRRRAVIHRIDVQDRGRLVPLMRQYHVICNLAGPNYLNAVPAVEAAIAAGVHLVDVSDDWEATLRILGLHGEAVRAGVSIVVGLGASPGVTNVLARAGADRLDRVEEVRTAWIMRGSDMGGPALSRHLLYSLPHRAFVFEDGAMREVRPFVDGKEVLDFPELGPVAVTHIGHPEPFTLSRYIDGVRYADDKATFLPDEVGEMIVTLGGIARSGHPVMVHGASMDPMEFAAAYLHQTCGRMTGVSQTGALRTEVRGELAGRPTRIVYSAAGRIGVGTGVPAAIGACLLGLGKISRPGVYPPEACIDPEWFMLAISTRDLGVVREEILAWEREEPRLLVPVA
jgi:saccharopine dehydrogenase-like NADP-dependent oxidoreductase